MREKLKLSHWNEQRTNIYRYFGDTKTRCRIQFQSLLVYSIDVVKFQHKSQINNKRHCRIFQAMCICVCKNFTYIMVACLYEQNKQDTLSTINEIPKLQIEFHFNHSTDSLQRRLIFFSFHFVSFRRFAIAISTWLNNTSNKFKCCYFVQ